MPDCPVLTFRHLFFPVLECPSLAGSAIAAWSERSASRPEATRRRAPAPLLPSPISRARGIARGDLWQGRAVLAAGLSLAHRQKEESILGRGAKQI